jgi:outer membrane lipoprotein-sorting protein
MMGASWMGSHFTNDDLVKESRFSEDYSIKTSFAGDADGVAVYRFTLTPKPSAPVVWGKIEVTVRQADLQPVRQDFYDEDGKRVRELAFSHYRTVSGRTMPTIMTMRPLDGSGEFTRITWKKIDFSVDLERSFFSVQRLRSM